MFQGVTRARMYFFHTNPSGRILNRFSKDMGQVDEILPSVMIDVIQIFLQLAGIIVVIAVVNPWFIIPTVCIGIIFYYLRWYYLSASRNIKRVEATSKFYKNAINHTLKRGGARSIIDILFAFSPFADLFAFGSLFARSADHPFVWCPTHADQRVR